MPVTGNTPWRTIGTVPLSRYISEFERYRSPMLNDATAIHAAAGQYSALCLAMMHKEQKYASLTSIPASSHNPLSISSGWANGGHTWHKYPTWAAGVADWLRRITDPAGPYAKTRTLSELIGVYAPAIENDVGLYVRQLCDLVNAWQATPPTPPTPPANITFGRVKKPPVMARHLTQDRKPSGWSWLGKRNIVGTCVHRMEGTLRGSEQHFLSNDPHGRDALTDYGIGGALDGDLDGIIWEWIAEGDDRSPWASGPSDGLEGDGPAFVRAYGVSAINRDLRSVELSGKGDTPVTPKQFEAACHLIAYFHDQARVPWHLFPVHPVSNVVTQMQHREFARKNCPERVVINLTNEYQARVREIMRVAQTGTVAPPVDPPKPPEPVVPYSAAKDQAFLRKRFGELVRYDANGKEIARAGFDPKGIISSAWIHRADQEDTWPSAQMWAASAEGKYRQIVTFSNGWILLDLGDKPGWRWAGDESP